jgi:PilZ domain
MPFRESRRSTRVPLKVAIAVESGTESLTCERETIVVNLHGALLSTTIRLSVGMRISIHVYMTDKRAKARVVYADPENSLRCGIELISHETSGECLCRLTTGTRPPHCIPRVDETDTARPAAALQPSNSGSPESAAR